MTTEIPPVAQLKRFLHYGNVYGVYIPRSRWDLKYYTEEIVGSIRNVLTTLSVPIVIETIRKVHDQNTSPHPELIAFVVAECLRIPELKKDALALAEIVCSSPEAFLNLFAFGFALSPKIGTGRSIKRFIRAWYLKQEDIQLAVAVTKFSKFRGWTHKDVIFLGRVKSDKPAKRAILTYATRGLKEAIDECSGANEAAEVVEYLKTVDKFRKCVKSAVAAEMIETHMLSVEHLNFLLLKDKQVWCALLRQLPLETLLRHFQLISKSGLFRDRRIWDDAFQEAICDALTSMTSVNSGLHPSEPYVEMLAYKHLATFKLSKRSKEKSWLSSKPPLVSPSLTKAFEQLIDAMLKNLKPTGLKFLISVDPSGIAKRKCRYLSFADAHHVAAIILASLYKADENVTIVSPVGQGKFDNVDIVKGMPVFEVAASLTSSVKPAKPLPASFWKQPQCSSSPLFDFAVKSNKDVDVFVIIDVCIFPDKCLENFQNYKKKNGKPNTKLILCSLCAPFINESAINETDILAISGFDRHAGKLISSFLANAF